jgi:3-deoxy-D-manno-octulosonic acid kinase
VPRPVAAAYHRSGAAYTADLVTARIPGAEPLIAHVARRPLPAAVWRDLGRCIRRFHDAGVCHADLNVHNLLLDREDTPWLLDFDRGRVRAPGGWRRDNLDRFLRSLRKTRSERPGVHVAPADWQTLLEGYGQTSA